jgi:hypothetical protein
MRKWAILALILAVGVGLAARGTPKVAVPSDPVDPAKFLQANPVPNQPIPGEQSRQAPVPPGVDVGYILQAVTGGNIYGPVGWGSYSMGYKFTPTQSGAVTQLGRYRGSYSEQSTIKLWDASNGNLLASANVSGSGWSYANITPVMLTVGQNYWVSTYSGTNVYYYSMPYVPYTVNGVQIITGGYGYGDMMPNSEVGSTVYGMADIYVGAGAAYDVGATALLSPPPVCTLGPYIPRARVKNFGTQAQPASFYVKFRGSGSGTYVDSALCPALAADAETTLSFASWTISTKGAYTISCSTMSAADSIRADDKITGTIRAGLTRVLFLTAEQPSTVKQLADSIMNAFPNDFVIDTMDVGYYYQRAAPNVDSLLAKKYKALLTWANYGYTDANALGDSLAKYIERGGGGVAWAPFGTSYALGRFSSIYSPVSTGSTNYGTVTMGTVHRPTHKVMEGVSGVSVGAYSNYGSTLSHTTAYKVVDWNDGQILVACNDTITRRGALLGFFPTGFNYSSMSGDWKLIMRNLFVWLSQNDDVGVSKIEAPSGTLDSGASVTPACSVFNYGSQAETYQVRMKIGSTYDESTLVTSHAPGAYNYVTFPSWTAIARGNAAVSCSTRLTIDQRQANDKLTGTAFVRVQDVGVTTLTVPLPGASYKYDTAITPKASWRNYGNVAAVNFEAWMLLSNSADGRVYSKKVVVPSLAVGGSIEVGTFPRCTLRMGGAWTSRCSTYLAADVKFANDTLNRAFTVTGGAPPPPPTTWVTKNPMPAGAKMIKDGGWMAYDAGKARIYATRGQKQPDFWAYVPLGDSWSLRAPWQPGTEGKLPQKGSVGCATGSGVVYATKGNNTTGFYTYSDSANVWTQKKDVPLGVSNKKVKGGTDIVWAYKGSVGSPYLLKGYKNEFYRYDVGADSFQTLTPAPVGANLKYDKGSWLAYDGVKTIYAFKAKYHEFYSYNTETDSWNPTALLPMPIPGSAGSKKSKDGGCGTYVGGAINSIYALKGGNTREFWKYTVATNAWVEKETLPSGTFKKKVKAGADIVAAGLSVYATKGNKSNELWMYVPSGMVFEAPRHDGALAGKTAIAQGMSISPNPLATGFAVLRYGLPKAGAAQVSVYNVTGQTVMAQTLAAGRSGIVNLDLRHLGNGVYLVKLSSEGYVNSQKLVVQR